MISKMTAYSKKLRDVHKSKEAPTGKIRCSHLNTTFFFVKPNLSLARQ